MPPDMPLREAAREMATRWIRHLPVVDDGRLLGVVSMRDVTGIFAALAPAASAWSTSSTSWSANAGWPASSTATSTSGWSCRSWVLVRVDQGGWMIA